MGHEPIWAWAAVVAAIVVMLLVDLLVVNREAHAVTMKEAGIWSVVWVTIGLGFGAIVWATMGHVAGGEYFAGYLIEKSLSVDNLFVFAVIFSFFAVPAAYQHRVLFWGVLGALVFRAIFIALGAALLKQFSWIEYVFGVFLVYTAIRMARSGDEQVHPEHNPVLRLMRRRIPMTEDYRGPRFFVRENAKRFATPLLAVLVVVETTDIVFAVDSIPAIFAITDDAFIVFTSNAFAILGLRALYFLLAGMLDRFHLLKYGLAVVLAFVGAKMLLHSWVEIPIAVSLIVIMSVLAISVIASLRTTPPLDEDLPAHQGEGLAELAHEFDHEGDASPE
ncbi:MAG: TerC family protein [Acidimicrobiia bacterium]